MGEALRLLGSWDPDLWGTIGRSLLFSASAVLFAAIPGIPAGIAISWRPSRTRRWLAAIVNALSAVPTVVIGLFVYGFISRTGPLGFIGMLYTPAAVVTGQVFLALPILVSFIITGFSSIDARFVETLDTHAMKLHVAFLLALGEARLVIRSAVAMAFSRVIGEVGVAMMLGGNIRGLTRTMT
ncbi:MAG: ABC transporter permease, partial [Rectinema sp.]|nr:ABC transporter permease [Rectinema sp.]